MKIFDLHNDFLVESRNNLTKQIAINNFKKAEAEVCSAVWTTKLKTPQDALKALNFVVKDNNNLHLCIEDLHFLTLNFLQDLVELNPTYVSLTWNEENNLAGGAESLAGLSLFGSEIVQYLQEKNITIDTAHLNERSFLDVAKISTKPLICSHTACYALAQNQRNIKDYQIKIIEESGGIVGMYFVSYFVSNKKNCNIGDVAKQIEYYCTKFDINHLCIGSDFYGTKHLPMRLKNYFQIQNLKKELIKRGFNGEEIDKIFYQNAQNFFQKNG